MCPWLIEFTPRTTHPDAERGEIMADPRNIAHDKKVQEEKKHQHTDPIPAALVTPQPGKKPPLEKADVEADGHESFHQHQQQEELPEAE
jgi:hypothetical protein